MQRVTLGDQCAKLANPASPSTNNIVKIVTDQTTHSGFGHRADGIMMMTQATIPPHKAIGSPAQAQ